MNFWLREDRTRARIGRSRERWRLEEFFAGPILVPVSEINLSQLRRRILMVCAKKLEFRETKE